VKIINSTLSGNHTKMDGSSGGGVYVRQDTAVSVINSTIAGNYTQGPNAFGGGIFTENGPVTLTNSTLSSNTARKADGGGIFANAGMAPPSGSARLRLPTARSRATPPSGRAAAFSRVAVQ
jgi:hypothetical protein